jgi:hypothetical protein
MMQLESICKPLTWVCDCNDLIWEDDDFPLVKNFDLSDSRY